MPSQGDGDACYGGITSIPYSRTMHPLLSWKASQQVLVGILMNLRRVSFAKSGQHLTSVLWNAYKQREVRSQTGNMTGNKEVTYT